MKYAINKIEFQKRLCDLMEEKNETVYTLAEKLNLSPATISRYSSGKMSPKITTIEVLSRIFGLSPAWMMGYNVEKYSLNPENQPKQCEELNELCKQMNTLGMVMLVEYAKFILTKEEYIKEENTERKKITA